jgi:RimJ/RimL family protein N-acetyltransferase
MTRNEFDKTLDQEVDFLGKIASSKTQLSLVGILDQVLVAVLTFTGRVLERVRYAGEVGLVVSKDCWGIGIGKQMMQNFHQWADDNPVTTKINLRVRLSNRRAIKLHEGLGYQIEG